MIEQLYESTETQFDRDGTVTIIKTREEGEVFTSVETSIDRDGTVTVIESRHLVSRATSGDQESQAELDNYKTSRDYWKDVASQYMEVVRKVESCKEDMLAVAGNTHSPYSDGIRNAALLLERVLEGDD